MSYSSEVLTDTPLGYWKLDETVFGAAVLLDGSGNARHGTYAGTATSTTGLVAGDTDKAVTFSNGRGIATYGSWQQAATWSVVATIKPSTVSGTQTVVARYDGASVANSAWTLRLDGNKLAFYPFIGSTFTALLSTTSLVAGTTYDVAATYDGTTASLYVNGVLEASGARSGVNGTASTVPLSIGAASGGGETFAGVVDDVSYFGSALAGTSMAALASARTGTGYSAAVLARTPLAYYRLNDTSSFNGTVVTTMADSSGNSRSGGYANSPAPATSLLADGSGGALTFNGTNYGDVSYASWMQQANFSVEAIFKPSTVSGTQTIICRHDASGGSTWILRQDAATLTFYVLTTGFVSVAAAGSLVAGVKHHVVCTYDGSTARIYLDGTLSNSAAVGGPAASTNTGRLRVGASAAVSGGAAAEAYTGTLDEAAFYGTVLSPTRIAAHNTAANTASSSSSTSTLAGTLPSPTVAIAGAVTPPLTTGTLAGSAPSPTGTATGTATPPPIAGSLTESLPALTGALAGATTPPGSVGVLSGSMPSPTVALAGAVTAAPVTGSLVSDLPGFTADFEGDADDGTSPITHTDRTDYAAGRTRNGGAEDFSTYVPVPRPAHLAAMPQRIVAQQLPTPTLVKGRPQ